MKRCPQCKTTYSDDTLNFCLEDGEWLIGDAEPATAILPEFGVPPSGGSIHGDDATRPQIYATAEPQDDAGGRGFDKRLLLAPIALTLALFAGLAGYRYFSSVSSPQIS